MPAIRKLLSTRWINSLRDPQSWVSLIAASTLIGLCAGVFEPSETAAPAAEQQLALADSSTS